MHCSDFSNEYVPAGHLTQLSSNGQSEHFIEPSKEYCPSGHLIH
jgi:hypothetical protein